MSSLGDNIKNRRIELGLSQEELADKLGYKSRSTIAKIESGINDLTQSKIAAFAKVLNTTRSQLMGDSDKCAVVSPAANDLSKYGIHPIEKKKFRMLGSIACGEPIYCDEDYKTFIEASADINADFCLTAKGDSMINARIYDGDVVFIKSTPEVYNGEIAAVVVEDEATLKRVYYYREENKVVLVAENPKYAPLVYVNEELNHINILGRAVAFMSNIK